MCCQILKLMFILCATAHFCVQASTPDEVKQKYAQLIMECSKDNPVTAQDIEQLKRKEMPDSHSVKCLFACAYKRSGMMDEQGNLSVEGILRISQSVYMNDPTRLQKAMQFTEACRSVNDQPVSDEAAGCDRAALIFRCTVDNAPHFDFVL